MMRMAVWLAVVSVSVWPGCTAARGKVIAQAFADVAKQSSMVLIGHVERVRTVHGVSVADVRRAVMLKGTCGEVVPVMADGTWMCDISAAVEGEWALFALEEVPSERDMGIEPSEHVRRFLEWARQQHGDARPMVLAFWGRGRLPVRMVNGVDCVLPLSPDLEFPQGVRWVEAQDGGPAGIVLDDVVALVEGGSKWKGRWSGAEWRRAAEAGGVRSWRVVAMLGLVAVVGWAWVRWVARRRRVDVGVGLPGGSGQ